ncbi:MAG: hypothetical protein KKA84_03730 [Bacteroidetes bacterium]|nr:hypothetical protein [Bacteroidota bacterium]
MTYTIHDFIGNIGVLLILLSYLLLQFNKIKSETLRYSVMNGVGASLVVYSLYFDFNLSSLIVEGFWLLISIAGVIRYFLRKK